MANIVDILGDAIAGGAEMAYEAGKGVADVGQSVVKGAAKGLVDVVDFGADVVEGAVDLTTDLGARAINKGFDTDLEGTNFMDGNGFTDRFEKAFDETLDGIDKVDSKLDESELGQNLLKGVEFAGTFISPGGIVVKGISKAGKIVNLKKVVALQNKYKKVADNIRKLAANKKLSKADKTKLIKYKEEAADIVKDFNKVIQEGGAKIKNVDKLVKSKNVTKKSEKIKDARQAQDAVLGAADSMNVTKEVYNGIKGMLTFTKGADKAADISKGTKILEKIYKMSKATGEHIARNKLKYIALLVAAGMSQDAAKEAWENSQNKGETKGQTQNKTQKQVNTKQTNNKDDGIDNKESKEKYAKQKLGGKLGPVRDSSQLLSWQVSGYDTFYDTTNGIVWTDTGDEPIILEKEIETFDIADGLSPSDYEQQVYGATGGKG